MNKNIYKVGHFMTSRSAFIKKINRVVTYPIYEKYLYLKLKNKASKKGDRIGMKDNNYVYCLSNRRVLFFLPMYRCDLIQRTIFLEDDYYNGLTNDYLFNKWNNGKLNRCVENRNILDVGANIGDDTLYYCLETKAAHVFSFEPVDSTFDILKQNIRLNNMEKNVTLYKEGCGKDSGKANITKYSQKNSGGTQLGINSNGDICINTIDSHNIPNVAFIKIDVEGFEYDVICGAINTIKTFKPVLYVEIKEQDNFDKICKVLFPIGYQLFNNNNTCISDFLFY